MGGSAEVFCVRILSGLVGRVRPAVGSNREGKAMQYMMFVATDAEPDEKPEAPGDIEAWLEEVERTRKRVTGNRLKSKRQAKTVRMRKGKLLVTDGPFAETREVIVGFDILECDSMEEAIAVAAKHPMARAGRIELREFWPD
jgi:hypothetical protein